MSRNLVRECVHLQLDKNQQPQFQKGDYVEILSGSYRGRVGRVAQASNWTDKGYLLVRVDGWPYSTLVRVALRDVRAHQTPEGRKGPESA